MILLLDAIGLAILVAPIKSVKGATPTAFFLFTQQLILALLIVDLFRPVEPVTGSTTGSVIKSGSSIGKILGVTGHHLAGLKFLASISSLFVIKFVSMWVGMVHLFIVINKYARVLVTSRINYDEEFVVTYDHGGTVNIKSAAEMAEAGNAGAATSKWVECF